MQSIGVDNAGDSRLRFVFGDTVVSFSLPADATFEDVARTLGELSNERYGNPVAVDVTLGSRQGDSARRMLCRPNFARIAEYEEFLIAAPLFEQLRRSLRRSTSKGTISTSPSAGGRCGSQANDLLRQWKTSPIGRVAVKHRAEYPLARDAMLGRERTNPVAPWTIVKADGSSGSSSPLSLVEQDFDAALWEALRPSSDHSAQRPLVSGRRTHGAGDELRNGNRIALVRHGVGRRHPRGY